MRLVGALGAERSAKDAAFAAVSALEAIHISSGLPRKDMNYKFPLMLQTPIPIQKEYEVFLEALGRVRLVDPTSLNKYVFVGLLENI